LIKTIGLRLLLINTRIRTHTNILFKDVHPDTQTTIVGGYVRNLHHGVETLAMPAQPVGAVVVPPTLVVQSERDALMVVFLPRQTTTEADKMNVQSVDLLLILERLLEQPPQLGTGTDLF